MTTAAPGVSGGTLPQDVEQFGEQTRIGRALRVAEDQAGVTLVDAFWGDAGLLAEPTGR